MTETYRTPLLEILKTVVAFQDRELTYATRETDLHKQQTGIWSEIMLLFMEISPLMSAVNPDTTNAIANGVLRLIDLTTQIHETANLRVQNVDNLRSRLAEIRQAMPKEEKDGPN